MQKILKKFLSFGLALIVCLGITIAVNFTVTAVAATDYYASVTAKSGTALLGQLHDLIVTSRTKYSSYADCKTYGSVTDPGSGVNTVMEFYTQQSIPASSWDVNGGWNREHVWCKSLSNGLWTSQTVGGGSDLHHIRPSEKYLNARRGNLKYGEVTNGTAEYQYGTDYIGGYSTSSAFEPNDNVKGDVARIVMYVYTHYNTYANVYGTTNGTGSASYFGTLNFTHVMAASSEAAAIELLLEWNKLDPVDAIETARNEAVYKIQGNRNPFIDHPEYAAAIWGNEEAGGSSEQPAVTGTEAFKNAVAAISADDTLDKRRAQLNAAINAYRALSAMDKSSVKEEYETLQFEVEEFVLACNFAAANAENTGLKPMGTFFEGAEQ